MMCTLVILLCTSAHGWYARAQTTFIMPYLLTAGRFHPVEAKKSTKSRVCSRKKGHGDSSVEPYTKEST